MQPRLIQEIDALADHYGATSWAVVRSRAHILVEFAFADGTVRQTISATPSDQRAVRNRRAELGRAVRELVA